MLSVRRNIVRSSIGHAQPKAHTPDSTSAGTLVGRWRRCFTRRAVFRRRAIRCRPQPFASRAATRHDANDLRPRPPAPLDLRLVPRQFSPPVCLAPQHEYRSAIADLTDPMPGPARPVKPPRGRRPPQGVDGPGRRRHPLERGSSARLRVVARPNVRRRTRPTLRQPGQRERSHRRKPHQRMARRW